MLQSGLIMKWKTVIIYLQTALLSSQLTPSLRCTGRQRTSARPAPGAASAPPPSSPCPTCRSAQGVQGDQYRVLLQTLSRAPSRCWLRASSSPSRCWQWSCAAARGLGAARRASATHSLPEHQQCSE